MNLGHDFVQVSKLSEDQKKRSSTKMEHFFPQIQVKTKKIVVLKVEIVLKGFQILTTKSFQIARQNVKYHPNDYFPQSCQNNPAQTYTVASCSIAHNFDDIQLSKSILEYF